MGPLIPLFWTSADVYPGFPCFHAWPSACNRILRFTSFATPADLFAQHGSRAILPGTCEQVLVGLETGTYRLQVAHYSLPIAVIINKQESIPVGWVPSACASTERKLQKNNTMLENNRSFLETTQSMYIYPC